MSKHDTHALYSNNMQGYVHGMAAHPVENFRCLDALVHSAAGEREMLGGLLLNAERISQTELDMLLAEQDCHGEKLGAILMRRGYLSMSELDAILSFQKKQSQLYSGSGPLRLGTLLVATNEITELQLENALKLQDKQNLKLGDVLVAAGYANPVAIKRGLRLQKRLLSIALSTILSASAILGASEAAAGNMKAAYTNVNQYQVAYEQGREMSKNELEELYQAAIRGLDLGEKALKKSVKMLEYVAAHGLTQAQFTLGMVYIEEEYTAQKGLYWLQRASSNGHKDAEFAYQSYTNRDYSFGC